MKVQYATGQQRERPTRSSSLRRSGWLRVLAALLAVTAVAACSSSDAEDPVADDTEDGGGSGSESTGGDGAVSLCDYLPDDDLDALNPRGYEPVSTILLGDFTYLGCTIGDVYSVSFGIRVVDDGDPTATLTGETEDLDGFGDEATVAYERYGSETYGSQTVATFGDVVLLVRNSSIGNSDPDVRVEDERIYEAMEAVVAALPDDFVERALTAEVNEDVCPAVDSDLVTELAGEIVLARGGHADDADRCAYRGENGTQIRLSSRASDTPVDYEPAGDPISLPNIEGADGAILDDGSSVSLTVISPGERISLITVISDDHDADVDADAVIALAEEFLTIVG